MGSAAFTIPRHLANMADMGSIENARGRIEDSRTRRSMEEALLEADSPIKVEPDQLGNGTK
jgi:hypothetical protein